MTWLDAILIVFLVLGALRGLFTGKLLPLLIILAVWIMSIALAVNFEERLASTLGDYHWYRLLAFFIILSVIQVAIYWSGIPTMVVQSIRWRSERWMDMAGGLVLGGCLVAIYGGLVWRILTAIAVEIAIRPDFDAGGTGIGSTFYNLVMDSATRSPLVNFIEAFEPPLGVVLGSIIGAVLIGLAVAGRLRGSGTEAWADDGSDESDARGDEQESESAPATEETLTSRDA